MYCFKIQSLKKKTQITESVMSYSPKPLLNFTANIIEVLGFSCELH